MNDQPIYLEASEEITSVIDRLRQSGGKSVTFVVPAGATLIQSIVNLKLLKRAASASGKSVEIVTGDRMGRNLASQIGFTVFGSLEDLKASKPFKAAALPKTPKGAATDGIVAAEPAATPVKMKSRPVPEELPEEVPSPTPEPKVTKAAAAAETPAKKKPSRNLTLPSFAFLGLSKGKKGLMVGGGLLALLVAVLLVTYVFATATITITPKADPANASADVTASKDVTTVSESGTMPAQVVSADEQQTGSFQATGQKDIGSKATGTVTITNCKSAKQTFTIPAGTVLTNGGASFTTNSSVTTPTGDFEPGCVASNSSVSVGVSATSSGSSSNVSGAFTVPNVPSGVTASGSTSGGTTKTVTVISQDDLDKAKSSLSDKIQSAAADELKKKLSSDQPILDGATAVDISAFAPSALAGTQTDSFTAQENGTATVLTYHKGDLKQLLVGQIQGKLAGNKQVIAPDSGIQTTVVSVDAKSGTLRLHAILNGFVADKFDTGALAASVKGKSITDARKTFLNHSDIAETEISVWPSYKGRLPFFAKKITIKIATPKTNS